MTAASIPWLELSIAVPLFGALAVACVRDPHSAARWCLGFAGVTLICTLVAWAGVEFGLPKGSARLTCCRDSSDEMFSVSIVLSPLLPLVAPSTSSPRWPRRTQMTRFSFSWMLVGESIRLATLSCTSAWVLGAWSR